MLFARGHLNLYLSPATYRMEMHATPRSFSIYITCIFLFAGLSLFFSRMRKGKQDRFWRRICLLSIPRGPRPRTLSCGLLDIFEVSANIYVRGKQTHSREPTYIRFFVFIHPVALGRALFRVSHRKCSAITAPGSAFVFIYDAKVFFYVRRSAI